MTKRGLVTLGELCALHREQLQPSDSPEERFALHSIPAFDADTEPELVLGCEIRSGKFTVPEGAVLLSKLNPRIPRVWEPAVDGDVQAISSTEFLVLLPRKGVDRRFLAGFCRAPEFRAQLEGRVTGTSSSHQRVRPEDALSIGIPALIGTGDRIAAGRFLGAIQDRIDLSRGMNRTLRRLAGCVFRQFFDRSEARHEEPLGDAASLPPGWELGTIADICDLNPEVWRKNTAPKEIRYLDLSAVKWGEPGVAVPYRYDDAPSRARRCLADGDTIIGTVRPANGSHCLVLDPAPELTGSTGFAVLRPRDRADVAFAYCWLTRPEFIEYLASVAHGSAYPAVDPKIIHGAELAIPPSGLRAAFGDLVEPLLRRQHLNRMTARTLLGLRELVLPQLISGHMAAPTVCEGAASDE